MRLTVLKYRLRVADGVQEVSLHPPGNIVHVGHQGDPGVVMMWAEADVDEGPTQKRLFYVAGTGMLVDPEYPHRRPRYIGSAVHHESTLVWHVYELVSIEERGIR